MILRNLLILPYLLCPYESTLYDFCGFFFLYVKNIEHQTLISFLLLTSIFISRQTFFSDACVVKCHLRSYEYGRILSTESGIRPLINIIS